MSPNGQLVAGLGMLSGLLLAFHLSQDHGPPVGPVSPEPAPVVGRRLLVFTARGCAQCRDLKASLNHPKVREVSTGWNVEEVTGSNTPRARQYQVTACPTIVAEVDGKQLGRQVGYLPPDELRAWIQRMTPVRLAAVRLPGASVGGPILPDGKTEIHCDLPGTEHCHNVSSKGEGCCVQTSINHSARWQNIRALIDFHKWVQQKGLSGGANPELTDQRIPACCKDRGYPTVKYLQVQKYDPELLKKASESGRMPGVTYSVSPTGRYGGRPIAHMVSLPHFDGKNATVLDNNYPGADKYEHMSEEEFRTKVKPNWAVILLGPPPPPPPRNFK